MNADIRNTTIASIDIERKEKTTVFFNKAQLTGGVIYVFWIMTAAIMAVFIEGSLQIITGPILAVCFAYLYFNGYRSVVTAIIVVANDALGCIFLGNVSFPYLLCAFLLVSVLQEKKMKIRLSQGIAGVILIITLFTLYLHDIANMKQIFYTLTFVIASSQCISDDKEELFFKSIAITVFLISLHTCITGGVEFYELNEYSTAFLRKGLLGVGIGDSNMSSLLLNIGIACTLFDKDFRWYVKTIMVIAAMSALAVTLSTSGILGLALVIVCYLLGKKGSMPRKIWNILIVVLAALIIITVYMSLPEASHNPTIDAYIDRMVQKIDILKLGDFAEFTTNRSTIADVKLDYFWNEQGLSGLLLGGNSLYVGDGYSVPHNTYIDLLLQIGLIGTATALIYIIHSFHISWENRHEKPLYVVLKMVFLYYYLNLSLYQGSLFSLSYLCLIAI